MTGVPASAEESLGANDRAQLAQLERIHQRREASRLMAEGVTLMDPARIDIRGSLRAGRDCVIDINVVFEGTVTLGDGVHIGPGCVIRDSALGDGVSVEPMSFDRRGFDRPPIAGSDPLPGCGRVPIWPSRYTSATSSRPRRRVSGPAAKGQPSGLPGRCVGGRGEQYRGRRGHLQLRRGRQAPYRDRRWRFRRHQRDAGRAARDRGRCLYRCRIDDHHQGSTSKISRWAEAASGTSRGGRPPAKRKRRS